MTFANSVFRIDKFSVPNEHKSDFILKLKETHVILDKIEGCLQNSIFEQISENGEFNIITLVQWEDENAFKRAGEIMNSKYQSIGFDPRIFMKKLEISFDLSNYRLINH